MAGRSTQRKERLRQATQEEIRTTARTLLTERGPTAVTMNAVARAMGISGPALYHYYAGHNALVEALAADFYRELADSTRTARDARPDVSATERLLATCRAMRSWTVAHPAECGWIFTRPVPQVGIPSGDPERRRAGLEFEKVFLEQFVRLWQHPGFPTPAPDALDPGLREQLRRYTDTLDYQLPPEAAQVFLSCWTRLYGVLSMEVLGQLDFAFTDLEPVFEQTLREMLHTLRLTYTPPPPTG